MSLEDNATSHHRFEAMIDDHTASYLRWLRGSCKLPSYTEAIRCAVSLFTFCHEQFLAARRIVLVAPDHSQPDRDVWPLELRPGYEESPLLTLSVNINDETSAAIDRIKDAYELDSDDAVVPLILENYVTIAHGLAHGFAVQTCTF